MRKSIAYLVLLLLPWVARAQALADWYYWFDTDNAPRQSGKMSGLNAHLQVDASQLEAGAHMLYIQVVDTAGVYSPPMGNLFVHVPDASKGSTLRYWFDGSTATYDQPYTQGQHLIDVGKLVPGFHFINYYVLDGHGIGTNVQSAGFHRTPMQSQQRLHYWFAGDSLATQVPDYQNGFTLDVSRLREGFNTIYFQVVENGPTDIESSHFIKIPQTECAGDMTVVCIIDGKVAAEQKLPNTGGVIKWNMDVNSMDVGLHKAMFQIITPSGAGSSIAETYFIRTLSSADIATMQCNYAIDGYRHYSQKGTCDNGTFHFDLPVNEVEDGLHRIDYMLVAENGATTTQGSDWFYKTPLGGNGIKQYDYWINDKSQDVHSETLAKSQDPFQLIKLLPLTQEPIRSSCFQFEVKDDKPMMYAKNDIHFRFHDKSGRWVDADRQYVDYSVSQEVRNIKTLKNEQTFARPDSNEVKWFKFEAEKGDTVSFRSNQATSLQVFSPSGTEVYSTSGDKSVRHDGCHTWENGTYYVAIHDVTGNKSQLTLDYFHMDKYDVVDQDVRVVGNGGCSTITFKGNGFRDLYAVDLFDEQGDTIRSINVEYENDAITKVTFDFTGCSLGNYNSIFHFTEEDKLKGNIISVEQAIPIELATRVSFASRFLRGRTTTYTIQITNKGNMTAYFVPTELSLSTKQFNNIKAVHFKDGDGNIIDGINVDYTEQDSIDEDTFKDFENKINEITDLSSFIVLKDSTSNMELGFSDKYFTIPPMKTLTYLVEIDADDAVSLHASVPSKWFAVTLSHERTQSYKKLSNEGMCCEKEKWECITENVAGILGFIPGITSCIGSAADLAIYSAFEIMCANGNSTIDKMKNALSNNSANFTGKLLGTVLDCVGASILKKIRELKNKVKELLSLRKLKLQHAVNYDRIYRHLISQYDKKMYLAEDYYRMGNIEEAERIEKEAKSILDEAKFYKEEANKSYKVADDISTEIEQCNSQIDKENNFLQDLEDKVKKGLKALQDDLTCSQQRLDADKNCNKPRDKDGGTSTPVNSLDPNDIIGYTSAAGSLYLNDSITQVNYRIEFENDTAFATASAHTVEIKDTLNGKLYDLKSYAPTNFKIGEKTVNLDGSPNFVQTADMRPAINAIAQVEGKYDQKKGIVTWLFTSLDPMTMEPTDDVMQGFLPVNYDRISGMGEVSFDINLKQPFADGTEVSNKASIVFDNNEAIETPVWTNIVDAVAPESHIAGVVQMNDSTARISLKGSDNRSGVWKYEVYAQHGAGSAWVKAGECTADSGSVDFRFFEGMDYGFCVLATDSAGNVERKELSREASLGTATKGDVNGDGKIDMVDATLIVNYYLGKPDTYLNALSADTNDDGAIDIVDAIATTKLYMESAPPAHDTPKATRRRRVMKVKNQ